MFVLQMQFSMNVKVDNPSKLSFLLNLNQLHEYLKKKLRFQQVIADENKEEIQINSVRLHI